jgi:hypothetical protein
VNSTVKPQIARHPAPPLPSGGDPIDRIITITALHLRKTVPALADLTLDELIRIVFEDLRPQIEHVLDAEVEAAIEEDRGEAP